MSTDSPEEFFAGVDLDAMPSWTTAEDLASLSIAAFAKSHDVAADPTPCDDCNGTDNVQCVGGAFWCKPCREAFEVRYAPSIEDDLAIHAYLREHNPDFY